MKKVFVLVIMLLFSVSLTAQNLVDGERLDNIEIGKSTIDDVVAAYGTDYKLKKNSDYSNALYYEKLGLMFYSCQADPKHEIFTIVMQLPFNVQTSKGIILGKSTFNELFEAYGKWEKSSSGFEYEKFGFYFDTNPEIPENFESDNKNFGQAEKQSTKTDTSVDDNADSKTNNYIDSLNSSIRSNNSYSLSNDNLNQNNRSNEFSIDRGEGVDNDFDSSDTDDNSNEDKEFTSEIKRWGNEIVNKIELFEKGGLRQCHVDF